MDREYLEGVALVKKSGGKLHIVHGSRGVADETPVTASGTTVPRMLKDRFADVVNIKDFGAKGDGATDDTSVFEQIETAFPDAYVNLLGRTFLVTSLPSGARYFNGAFKYNGNLYTAEYSFLRNGSFFFAAGQGAANSLSPYAYRSDIIAIGRQAAYHVTTARNCIAIGEGALFSAKGGRHNIAIGNESLYSLESDSTGSDFNGTRNTALGGNAGHFVTTGNRNIIVGRDSGHAVTTGAKNVIIGNASMLGDCPNSLDPGVVINQTPLNPTSCVVIGASVARYLSGVGCVAVGESALENAKLPSGTVAIGYQAGQMLDSLVSPFQTKQNLIELAGTYTQSGGTQIAFDTSGEHGFSVGDKVLLRFTTGLLSEITFADDIWFNVTSVPSATQFTVTTEFLNVASGSFSATRHATQESASSGISDTLAVGYIALRDATTAVRTTVIGSRAGTKGGNYSTYVGAISGNTATGAANTAVGTSTLPSATGSDNTVLGYSAGIAVTSGGSNTLLGRSAGAAIKTGSNNAAVGAQSLSNATTAEGCVALGVGSLRFDFDGGAFNFNGCVGLGTNTRASGDNQVQLGNSDQTPYAYAALQLRSDERDKADIKNIELGLSFINALRPVQFRWDCRDDYLEEVPDGTDDEGMPKTRLVRTEKDGSKKRTRFHCGLIAQEVKAVADSLGVDFGGYQDHALNGGADVKSLGYGEFIAPLIKAVQELSSEVATLKKALTVTGIAVGD